VALRGKKYDSQEETEAAQIHATLPYQLFATRVAHYLRWILKNMPEKPVAQQVQDILMERFKAILAGSGVRLNAESMIAEVSESQDNPRYYNISLKVQPPYQIFHINVDVSLEMQIQI